VHLHDDVFVMLYCPLIVIELTVALHEQFNEYLPDPIETLVQVQFDEEHELLALPLDGIVMFNNDGEIQQV